MPARTVRHRFAFPVWSMLLALLACAGHPPGNKDLLTFLEDGTTTKRVVTQTLGEPPHIWGNGDVWTYRIERDRDGFYIPTNPDPRGTPARDRPLDGTRYSLVLEFDQNGVLSRHALVDLKQKP